jgi:hypothetical protein
MYFCLAAYSTCLVVIWSLTLLVLPLPLQWQTRHLLRLRSAAHDVNGLSDKVHDLVELEN